MSHEVLFPKSFGTMGKGEVIKAGEEKELFCRDGEGCLSHFWFGGNFKGAENTRIRYYIDGEVTPSIDMELFMGHGIGYGDQQAPWLTKFIGKVGKQNGVFNNYRIPFGENIRVTAWISKTVETDPQIWWIIRGLDGGRVSLGGVELPREARLKLHRLDDLSVNSLEEFNLCQVSREGALFQVAMSAESESLTYLEACLRLYENGEEQPLFLSSGLEDYFLGTYYFDSGKFYGDTAGLTHFDKEKGAFSAYRIHDDDPVFFKEGMRLTCRCGETEHGLVEEDAPYLDPKKTIYTVYTWVYEW